MIYVIKFIYSFVLPPGLFVLLLLVPIIWLWKRERRASVFLLIVTLLFYLSSTSLVSDLFIRGLERQYAQPQAVQGDVIVVLGGGATLTTPDLNGKGNMLGSAANRLLTAVRLHKATGLPILFSGGQVFADSGNEANIAKRQLLALGVAESDILVENRSLNTKQNAINTALILKEHGFEHPVLVTSAFHMPRAVVEFGQAGLSVQPFPTDYVSDSKFTFYPAKLSPNAGAVSITGLALKEYLGLFVAKIR
ncbi:YdcF family protein [Paenibacillus agri]|uniref:YdcF family protein n=1 Tax=Paenibacillus agri TaxID=2744309 RepID=A0A850EQM4_9BACL|nr:YdcF family protein [Paenibacillus agri]NUU61544.1 YdcF family protein [Paenibacillus agri]